MVKHRDCVIPIFLKVHLCQYDIGRHKHKNIILYVTAFNAIKSNKLELKSLILIKRTRNILRILLMTIES